MLFLVGDCTTTRANASQMQGKCATLSNTHHMHAKHIKILGSLASGTTNMRHAHFLSDVARFRADSGNARQMHDKHKMSQSNQHF